MPSSIPAASDAPGVFPPLTISPQPEWGSQVQRTMRLLESSTPSNRKKVRILFYGQSITGSRYSAILEKWLREKYPHADLVVENRAIGGYASAFLYRTAEADLYPFYPDLLVFSVYGDHHRYEEILFNTRQRTTAEIMIVGDHWKPQELKDGVYAIGSGWGVFFEKFLMKASEKYGCEYVDLRGPWKGYLQQHNLVPQDLLTDKVHPNPQGKWLMAEICRQQFVTRPGTEAPAEGWVKDYVIDKDVQWKDGKLEMEFTGNRVDLISRPSGGTANGSAVRVLVDGSKPSEFKGNYAFTRATSITKAKEWPAFLRADSRNTPVAEDWALEITATDPAAGTIQFRVTGSVTGPDGEGDSTKDFVSNSGRLVITAEDWKAYPARLKEYKPGHVTRWQCVPLSTDIYYPPVQLDDLRENAVTLFQGVPNTRHKLELISEGIEPPPVSVVRVYSPPIPDGPFKPMGFEPEQAKATPEPTHTPIVK